MALATNASGNITTQNLVPAGVATTGSAVELALGGEGDTIAIQVTGTYTAVGGLVLQGTVDNTNWLTITDATVFKKLVDGVASATIPTTVQSIFRADVSGLSRVRVMAPGAVTGTAVVSILGGKGTF